MTPFPLVDCAASRTLGVDCAASITLDRERSAR